MKHFDNDIQKLLYDFKFFGVDWVNNDFYIGYSLGFKELLYKRYPIEKRLFYELFNITYNG